MKKKVSMKEKSQKDLLEIVIDNEKKLREMAFNATGAKSKNTNERYEIRKGIARAKTELRARELAASR